MEKNRTFYSLQSLRGLSFLIVLIYHLQVHSLSFSDIAIFNVPGAFGIIGVLLFFTISGFIMSHLISLKENYFLLRRILRIYPTYFIAVGVVIFFKVLIFGSIVQQKLWLSLTLLPLDSSLEYPLSIEWSLIYEIFFYMVCSLMAVFRLSFTHRLILMVVWSLAVIFYNLYFQEVSDYLPIYETIAFSIFNLCFIFGFLGHMLFMKINRAISLPKWGAFLFLLLSLGLQTLVFDAEFSGIVKLLSVSCLNLMVLFVFLWSESFVDKTSLLVKLGNASYGAYLLHASLITVFYATITNLIGMQLSVYHLVVAFVVTLILSYGFGKIDIKIHNYCRKVVKKL